MHPPSAVGLEHGRVVRSAGHAQDVPDDLLVVPAGGEFRFPGLACSVPVPAAPAIPVEDVPGAFRRNVQRVQRRTVRAAIGRGHLLISGAEFFVVFRPAAHFRGLLLTLPVIFLGFAVSGLFGVVVIGAGGAVDRHPDLLLLPALTVHPATAPPKVCRDMTGAYAEPVRQKRI